eukprot:12411777-Karenia_brevis.AAC.1
MSLVCHGAVGDWRLSDVEFLETFRSPDASVRHDVLAERSPLRDEDLISFHEAEHKYTFRGEPVPRSVTGLLHSYTHEFNPTLALSVMRPDKRKDLEARGVGSTDAEILRHWQFHGEVQRARGQLLHYHVEQALNGRSIEEPHSPELKQALHVINAFMVNCGLRPYRTEVCLYHEGLRVAGQADLLCTDKDNCLVVCDWKRCREIRTENAFRSMKEPLENLPDSNYWVYALQLNLYAYILSDQYGYTVTSMYLFVVHPELAEPRIIAVPLLEDEIRLLVQHELSSITTLLIVTMASRNLAEEVVAQEVEKTARRRRPRKANAE